MSTFRNGFIVSNSNHDDNENADTVAIYSRVLKHCGYIVSLSLTGIHFNPSMDK